MRETFELLRNEIRAAGVRQLPAGIILTGGASQLSGIAELGREVLEMPVRVAAPTNIGGLVDTLLTPGYCDRRRPAPVGRDDAGRRRAAALRVRAGDGRPRQDPRRPAEHLPVDTRELTVRTGSARGLADLTAACARVPRRHRAPRTACCRSSCRTPRPGSSSSRSARAPTTTCSTRSTDCCRARTGCTGTATARRATARTTSLPLLAPPSLTVPVLGGRLALGTWQSICLLDPNADNATPDGPAQLPRRLRRRPRRCAARLIASSRSSAGSEAATTVRASRCPSVSVGGERERGGAGTSVPAGSACGRRSTPDDGSSAATSVVGSGASIPDQRPGASRDEGPRDQAALIVLDGPRIGPDQGHLEQRSTAATRAVDIDAERPVQPPSRSATMLVGRDGRASAMRRSRTAARPGPRRCPRRRSADPTARHARWSEVESPTSIVTSRPVGASRPYHGRLDGAAVGSTNVRSNGRRLERRARATDRSAARRR